MFLRVLNARQCQFVVAGKEVWAVSHFFTTPDPQLFDKGRAVGGSVRVSQAVARVGLKDMDSDQGPLYRCPVSGHRASRLYRLEAYCDLLTLPLAVTPFFWTVPHTFSEDSGKCFWGCVANVLGNSLDGYSADDLRLRKSDPPIR